MTYLLISLLAFALLASLYAQVSQPGSAQLERDKTQASEATVMALSTQIAVVRIQASHTPTPFRKN